MQVFHHAGGGFPLESASYSIVGDRVVCDVAIGPECHTVTLGPADANRFLRAVADTDTHYRWTGRGVPKHGAMYITCESGDVHRLIWRWHTQSGRLEGARALSFLRSANHLRVCDGCDQERLIPPELAVCSSCGYYATDLPSEQL